MVQRTNQEWLTDLRGSAREETLVDLAAILVRGLRYALSDRADVTAEDVEDFIQDTLIRILDKLDTFRGESQFTTWAHKIAIRIAFTELRRRRWRDVSLDAIVNRYNSSDYTPPLLRDMGASLETSAAMELLAVTLWRLIEEKLSERQRRALIAVTFEAMPLEEVARRMGTNRNALYKLLHDARKKLKGALLQESISVQDILETLG